ncbi:MAG: glycoside hydrolase N-terminal domain-containing protein [Acutalibacteraceae bacterium]|nr:glycoside hydrolase N-terminal domain-containing protein [Acutalibacteraceae bacterium]
MEFYYTSPAMRWIDGLPIGNGRLAAMVQETDKADEITMNHEWLWAAGIKDRHADKNAKYLPFVRSLFKEGRHYEGALAANLLFAGKCGYNFAEREPLQRPAMAGEVDFEYACDKNEYIERRLNLNEGVVQIKRRVDSALVTSRYFVNCDNGLISFEWKGDSAFSGELALTRRPEWDMQFPGKRDFDQFGKVYPLKREGNTLILEGAVNDIKNVETAKFQNKLTFDTDGQATPSKNGVMIKDATYIYAVVNIAVATEGEFILPENPCELPTNWEQAKAQHTARFSDLMNRVEFCLEGKDASLDALTTNERVKKMKSGADDNGVCEMYFNFGRYLMASATVCAMLPTHLQGKWNNMIQPPWDSDYHLDINIQMNYWAAEAINMPEAAKGLIKYLNGIKEKGKENAQNLYGCRGILYPLSTDVWGGYYGVYGWTAWVGGAAWLAQHIWWHYIYSGDKEFLKNEAYDYFCQVAEFYEDYLQKGEDGIYHICPSYSPENPIDEQTSLPVGICTDCSMDIQLVFDSLNYAIKSAEILGVDADKVAKWKEMLENLPEFKITSDGRLMEWDKEYTEREPGHRHLSHLYGIYPSSIFTPESRIEQYNASVRSLDYRMEKGGGHTGWSRAWCACLFARIKRAKEFYEHYTALIKDFAAETLLDLHPPGVFQIDGNFGGVAAVVESIVGYYDDKAHILPALPEAWASGSLKGIKVPGGHTISVKWRDGVATEVEVIFGFEKNACVVIGDKEYVLSGNESEVKKISFN